MIKWTYLCCVLILGLNAKAQYQTAAFPLTSYTWMLKILPDTLYALSVDSLQGGAYVGVTNAAISDEQGNLLFYTGGDDVRNSLGLTMENGGYYLRDPSGFNFPLSIHVQGAIILPRPGSSTQYYLILKNKNISFSGYEQPSEVIVATIDMSYNNSLGKVIERKKVILSDTLSDSRMTACKHANGRDWWLVNHEHKTNRIYTHLITPDSIYGPFSQYIGARGDEADNSGYSLFTQSGDLFVSKTGGMREIMLLNFDRCSGLFSNYQSFPDSIPTDFMAFSPSGRFLYATNDHYLYQYDLWDSNIGSSCITVYHDTTFAPLLGMMALMPDNRIYQAGWTCCGDCISVIDSPDLKAPACSYRFHGLCFQGLNQTSSAPNYPNYNLGPLAGSGCDTITTVEDIAEKEKLINLYPNPTSDYIIIDYSFTDWSKGDVMLEVTNSIGQIMYQKQLPHYSGFHQVDVSQFASGLYTATIKRNGEVVAAGRFVRE